MTSEMKTFTIKPLDWGRSVVDDSQQTLPILGVGYLTHPSEKEWIAGSIDQWGNVAYFQRKDGTFYFDEKYSSIDKAKAACRADWEHRVSGALVETEIQIDFISPQRSFDDGDMQIVLGPAGGNEGEKL